MRDDLLPTSLEGKVARLVEECGEVLQICGKILRFGVQAQDPKTKIKYDNLVDLKAELADLKHSVAEVEAW